VIARKIDTKTKSKTILGITANVDIQSVMQRGRDLPAHAIYLMGTPSDSKYQMHVPEEVENHLQSLGEGKIFIICARHFSEEVVRQFWDNSKKHKCWAKRFDRRDACKFLHLMFDK